MEEYKICFENYEVSNLGNVRRKLKNGEYINIKGSISNRGKGYLYFQVQRDNKRINHLFHQLVAKCFISERPINMVIDHIDRNTFNNNVENLRYITQKENCKNTDRYIEDITETDLHKRHLLIMKLWRDKKK